MARSPYEFNEGAASKIAAGLGRAVSKFYQIRGTVEAAPLKAKEAEDAAAKKKAEFEAAHQDRVKKAGELSTARNKGSIALQKERQKTAKEQTNLVKTKIKEKSTPRATTPKPAAKPAATKPPAAPKAPAAPKTTKTVK